MCFLAQPELHASSVGRDAARSVLCLTFGRGCYGVDLVVGTTLGAQLQQSLAFRTLPRLIGRVRWRGLDAES